MDSDNSRKRKRSSLAAAPPTDHESGEESSSSDMGVIKRKNIVKGNEGGLKYICDVCSADITSTVSELSRIHPFAPAPSPALATGL